MNIRGTAVDWMHWFVNARAQAITAKAESDAVTALPDTATDREVMVAVLRARAVAYAELAAAYGERVEAHDRASAAVDAALAPPDLTAERT